LGEVDLASVAKLIPGYVGADIDSLIKECGISAVKRLLERFGEEKLGEFSEEVKENCTLNMEDFKLAMKKV
jgi:SpoVK/Ycf46/Vps4 family AAA+-type ATPase